MDKYDTLWNRLTVMDDSRITKHAFNMDYRNCRNNGCDEIKEIFLKIDIIENFNNRLPVNLTNAKSAIEDYYKLEWSEKLIQSTKLRTYRLFKRVFEQESYLKLNLKRHERSLLAQLRCGILPIRVETGRYVGETPDQSLCILCDSDSVEDEIHFVLKCSLYHDIRLNYLSGIFSGDRQWKIVVQNHPRKLARFLVCAYMRRKKFAA